MNSYQPNFNVNRRDRQQKKGYQSKLIWLTGLSGSGKSSLANSLEVILHENGFDTYILDGDKLRNTISNDLGFSDKDRFEHLRRVGEIAKLFIEAGIVVLGAFISPKISERDLIKSIVGEDDYIEVYIDTPIEICETRDSKGLYVKARNGMLSNFAGVNSTYEIPQNPSYIVSGYKSSIEHNALNLFEFLKPFLLKM